MEKVSEKKKNKKKHNMTHLGDNKHPNLGEGHILKFSFLSLGFPGGTSGKETTCQCRRLKRHWLDP